jgi:uncharacterized protein
VERLARLLTFRIPISDHVALMRCPVCQREFDKSESTALPFCSERCRTIDLGRWLGEAYRLPVVPDPEADDEPDQPRNPGDDDAAAEADDQTGGHRFR